MMQVLRQGCPGDIGQRCRALLTSLEVTGIYWAMEFAQGLRGVPLNELGGEDSCLSAVAGCLEHWIEPLWVSML